ncbi:MAG: 3'-5' exonuclease, PolB [Ignavibacteria bacterium]|nr:3'-5' exonuclease, PolB [Ignavibacteria bacterium]
MNEELYLVFDIETVPLEYDSFSESQQEYILRGTTTDEEKEKKLREMALSPLTAKVVCIGLQLMHGSGTNWEVVNRAAFSTEENIPYDAYRTDTLKNGDTCHITTERRILEDFWRILNKYGNASLVSFNGRNFDAPFLMLRSALHKIKPSRNLMDGTKFNYKMHYDMIDELCFYQGAQTGATKRYNFDFYAQAFGIKSPKAEGIDGSKVAQFYSDGRITEIAEYCLRDVTATWELFLIWKSFLKF